MNSIILWVKLRFLRVKLYIVVYCFTEGDDEDRERFWNYLDKILDNVGNGYEMCVMGDLNG